MILLSQKERVWFVDPKAESPKNAFDTNRLPDDDFMYPVKTSSVVVLWATSVFK
jgi:hypothetical protein